MAKRIDHEGPIHRACISYLKDKLPSAVVHHSPNEIPLAGRNVAKAIAKAKWNGMVPGFPDIIVFYNGRSFSFEVKAPKGAVQDTQEQVGALLQANGTPWAIVRSKDDVRACLAEWGIEVEGQTT